MKVGVTINNYFESYLEEIAKLNNLPVTSVCGLIIENFLSFNKRNKRFPLFQRQVNIVFANEKDSKCSGSGDPDCSDNPDSSVVQRRVLNKEEILAKLKEGQVVDTEIHDGDWLPF